VSNFSEYQRLQELSNSTPEEFANLEAEREVERERWHRRLARLFRLRSRHSGDGTSA
jgi:hypothetical protein